MAAAETAFHAALLNDPSSASLRRGVATPRHLPSNKGGLKDVLPLAKHSDFPRGRRAATLIRQLTTVWSIVSFRPSWGKPRKTLP